MKTEAQKYCYECSAVIAREAVVCPTCGAKQPSLKAGSGGFLKGCLLSLAILFGGTFLIGIVAAIVVPKLAGTMEKAYVVVIKSDLARLAAAEQTYHEQHQAYSSDVAELKPFAFSAGIAPAAAIDAGKDGWSATLKHEAGTSTCSIGVGDHAIGTLADGKAHCVTKPAAHAPNE